ncbi:uncharacterized protein LOC133299644 [Gastrolobium bilobum]|uniref:uncharacterized protein LOC133299644 n=1 Tax=Gastrolobium bilobum TaxID=150636 RepID=UPI002AB2B55B|nr:uncharacterized protein LOC133299644 [Gastrolobium bilobum]
MDEIRTTGKSGIGFRNKRWEAILDKFNKRANKSYTQKQLKNRMDSLRSDLIIWKQLLAKETGLGWNHEMGTIVADDAWWEAKIKDNAKYAKFRFQGLKFREELECIFGVTITSQHAWPLAMGVPIEDNAINVTRAMPKEIVKYGDEEFNLDKHVSPVVSMQKTLEQISNDTTEAAEMSDKSQVRGQFSIPNCIKILKTLNDEGKLDDEQFCYAVELLRVDKSRIIIIMSLSDSIGKLIVPGAKIPVDGAVIKGKGNANESMFTGETRPEESWILEVDKGDM